MTTDPTITIAGLETRIGVLSEALYIANRGRADLSTDASKLDARLGAMESERDALAAQLAEVRAELAAAPKVCAIHSYEHSPGPCLTCGAWPPGTRELIAACQTRIAGLEQAADERSKEVARLTDRVAELEAETRVSDQRLADQHDKWTARVAELEARPVVTEESLAMAMDAHGAVARKVLAHIGPVTLPPAQDRAEELIRSILGERKAMMSGIGATLDDKLSDTWASEWINATRAALASLGAPPTSPPAARPLFAGVSEEELALEYARAVDRIPGIRAVLARLEVSLVAPVDPEAVARDMADSLSGSCAPSMVAPPRWSEYTDSQRRMRSDAMRFALTTSGIPVTPEAGK